MVFSYTKSIQSAFKKNTLKSSKIKNKHPLVIKYLLKYIKNKERDINGEEIQLIKHENVKERVQHCTLFTEKWNNYFANNMLSGNELPLPLSIRK